MTSNLSGEHDYSEVYEVTVPPPPPSNTPAAVMTLCRNPSAHPIVQQQQKQQLQLQASFKNSAANGDTRRPSEVVTANSWQQSALKLTSETSPAMRVRFPSQSSSGFNTMSNHSMSPLTTPQKLAKATTMYNRNKRPQSLSVHSSPCHQKAFVNATLRFNRLYDVDCQQGPPTCRDMMTSFYQGNAAQVAVGGDDSNKHYQRITCFENDMSDSGDPEPSDSSDDSGVPPNPSPRVERRRPSGISMTPSYYEVDPKDSDASLQAEEGKASDDNDNGAEDNDEFVFSAGLPRLNLLLPTANSHYAAAQQTTRHSCAMEFVTFKHSPNHAVHATM